MNLQAIAILWASVFGFFALVSALAATDPYSYPEDSRKRMKFALFFATISLISATYAVGKGW